MRGLNVSISKNTALFARLPNNLVGMNDWYGGSKRRAKGKDNGDGVAEEAAASSTDDTSPSNPTGEEVAP